MLSAGIVALVAVLMLVQMRRRRADSSSSSTHYEQGQIRPEEIVVCKRPDGREWLLGKGSFGKVGP